MSDTQWACRQCTYLNHSLLSSCEMCTAPRPRVTAPASTTHSLSSTSTPFVPRPAPPPSAAAHSSTAPVTARATDSSRRPASTAPRPAPSRAPALISEDPSDPAAPAVGSMVLHQSARQTARRPPRNGMGAPPPAAAAPDPGAGDGDGSGSDDGGAASVAAAGRLFDRTPFPSVAIRASPSTAAATAPQPKTLEEAATPAALLSLASAAIDWDAAPVEVEPVAAWTRPPHTRPSPPGRIALLSHGPARKEGDRALVVLHVAEKPSVALALARALARVCGLTSQSGPEVEGTRTVSPENEAESGGCSGFTTVSSTPDAPPVHEFHGTYALRYGVSKEPSSTGKYRSVARAHHRVTSVTGHVYGVDFVSGYDDWEGVDPTALFGAKTAKVPSRGQTIPQHLQWCAAGSDVVVLWLDCDKEGENIAFEVLHNTLPWLNAPDHMTLTAEQQVRRATFSAVADADVARALATLRPPDKAVALAVDARQELDLKIGAAFTRLQTMYIKQRYGGRVGKGVISFGPCVTPTLALCVERYEERERFVAEDTWALQGRLLILPPLAVAEVRAAMRPASDAIHSDSDDESDLNARRALERQAAAAAEAAAEAADIVARGIPLEWARGRVFSEPVADSLLFNAQQAPSFPAPAGVVEGRVLTVTSAPSTKLRPTPLNTVALLKAASRGLGLGPVETMSAAESLYMDGFITYPRTETAAYPASFDAYGEAARHQDHPLWGDAARAVAQSRARSHGGKKSGGARAGEDAGDHPPITPAAVAEPRDLTGSRWRVYELVTRHFLGTLLEDCESDVTTATVSVGPPSETFNEEFRVSSLTVTRPGFTLAMPWLAPKETPYTLTLTPGQRVPIAGLSLKKAATEPPGLLTESDLIGLMEHHGIGTDASIPTHIGNIVARGFVSLALPGRRLAPLPLGLALTRGYRAIDPDLCSPATRARVERQLALVASGKVDYKLVVEHMLKVFRRKFTHFVRNVSRMDDHIAAFFPAATRPQRGGRGSIEDADTSFSLCGDCQRPMHLLTHQRPHRLYCLPCSKLYLLPSHGRVKRFPSDLKCPYDGFGLVYFTTNGDVPVAYPLCPRCFTDPPLSSPTDSPGAGEMSCDRCRHPTCPQSQLARGIRPCPNAARCGGGVLVLHTLSRPAWRLGCSACNYSVLFCRGARDVRLLREGEVRAAAVEEIKEEYAKPVGFHAGSKPAGGKKGIDRKESSMSLAESLASVGVLKLRASPLAPKPADIEDDVHVEPPSSVAEAPVSRCPICTSSLLRVEAHKDAPFLTSFFPGSSPSGPAVTWVYTGCLFCDPLLASSARTAYANAELDDGRGRGGTLNRARAEAQQQQRAEGRREEGRERGERMRERVEQAGRGEAGSAQGPGGSSRGGNRGRGRGRGGRV